MPQSIDQHNNWKNIKHLSHNEINLQKWDACVLNACNSLVYAESWYLDIVSPNWEALISGDYEYVMPLPIKKKFGIPFLVQPPLTQQLGIFSFHKIDENTMEHFARKIPYRSYHLNFNEQNPYSRGAKQPNFVLDLNKNYETLSAEYSTNTKRNIKKAQHAAVYVSENVNTEQFLSFYFSEEDHIDKPNKNITTNIVETGYRKEKLYFYGALNAENELISVLCLLRSEKRLVYLLAASNSKGKELSAMSLIVDKVIRNFAGSNSILDFEGSKVEGIARFYQGFGAKKKFYFEIKKWSVNDLIKKTLFPATTDTHLFIFRIGFMLVCAVF